MRGLIIGATALLAACATQPMPSPAAGRDGPPDKIEVVYQPGEMFFSVEDGGEGRFKVNEDYTFPVSHDDYVRIRDLLAPYRETGLVCGRQERWEHDGYMVWRENGVETRRPHESICYAEGHTEARRGVNQAYNVLERMAEERGVLPPLPVLPDPDRITLTSLYWGRVTQEWSIPRGGEARWTKGDETRAFAVSEADFDRLRDIFRPYEGVRFKCQRVITDGPYGWFTWSQEGHEDQRLEWDAGCVTGDAGDVFRRWDEAVALLTRLRDGG